jgi:hypothetical protein
MRSFVLVALLACGSSSKPVGDPAVASGDPAPCAGVAANLVNFIDQTAPVDKVKALLEQHCRDDTWSLDTRKCIITGKTEKDLDGCEKYFTGAQLQSFKKDLANVIPPPKPETAPATGSDVPPAANVIPN